MESVKNPQKSIHCDPCRRLKKISVVENSASKYCTHCMEGLCDVCFDHHQANMASADHVVIDNKVIKDIDDERRTESSIIYCEEHKTKKLDLFCQEHTALCCIKCLALIHKQCEQILTLEEAASGIKNSSICSKVLEKMNKYYRDLHKLEKEGNERISMLKEQRNGTIEVADKAIEKVKIHLETMRVKFKDTFHSINKENDSLMENKLKTIENQKLLVKHSVDEFRNKLENSTNVDIFIDVLRLQKLSSDCEQFINNKESKVPSLQIDFHLDECLSCFAKHFVRMGTYGIKDSLTCVVNSSINRCFKLAHTIRLLDKSCVTGLKFLSDGNIALVDSRFNALYLYGIEAKKIVEIGLPESPWDIELLDKNVLLVSFMERPFLQFVDVSKRKLRKELAMDEPKRGIVGIGNQIIICSKSKISIIDTSGNENYNFAVDDPLYICADNQGRLYFREQSNKLMCTDLNGHVIFTYTHTDLKAITGIACDSENNIYLAGFSSHNIHHLTPDGKLVKIYSDGICKPRAISVEKNGNYLLVSNNEGKEVKILTLSKNMLP